MAQSLKILGGDIVISPISGRPTLITGAPKLSQDVGEMFTIGVQPSGFGAGLEQLIGFVPFDQNAFVAFVNMQVSNSILVLRQLQNSDGRIFRAQVERILGLSFLDVAVDSTDPTKYVLRTSVYSESGATVSLPPVIVG